MFVWKNREFRVVSNNLRPTQKLVKFVKKHNSRCIPLRIYIGETLENIGGEYGFLFPGLLFPHKETSIKEVVEILEKYFQRYSQDDANPFVMNFLEALAESIPEEATNKKVA